MSRYRDTFDAGLEDALRHELRQAADSVEPAPDGLDKIRTKIVARRSLRPLGWSWTAADGASPRGPRLAGSWLGWLTGTVAESFRPDPGRAGWLGWLRPAMAVATSLLVIGVATWAITALPWTSTPPHSATKISTPGITAPAPAPSSKPGPTATHSGQPTQPGSSGYPPSTPSPTCTKGPQQASPSPSPSSSGSGTPSPTVTPSPSSGGSPTDAPPPASPSSSPPPGTLAPPGMPDLIRPSDATPTATPTGAASPSPSPSPTPSPSTSPSVSPCPGS